MSQYCLMEIPSQSLNKLCKNEAEITKKVKEADTKLNAIKKEHNKLLQSVSELKNKVCVLDSKICNYNAAIPTLEKEIEEVVKESEEVAVSTELIKWKQTKVRMVEDLEQDTARTRYKAIEQYKHMYEAQAKAKPPNLQQLQVEAESENNLKKQKLQSRIDELLLEIEDKQKKASVIDKAKLQQEIQMLQNRNIAIQVRLQRQTQEVEARLKQKLAELANLRDQ